MSAHPLTESMDSTMNVSTINRYILMLIIGKRRYSIKLWKLFTEVFNCLPVCAIIDDKIFCMHGGLSPDLSDMD